MHGSSGGSTGDEFDDKYKNNDLYLLEQTFREVTSQLVVFQRPISEQRETNQVGDAGYYTETCVSGFYIFSYFLPNKMGVLNEKRCK